VIQLLPGVQSASELLLAHKLRSALKWWASLVC